MQSVRQIFKKIPLTKTPYSKRKIQLFCGDGSTVPFQNPPPPSSPLTMPQDRPLHSHQDYSRTYRCNPIAPFTRYNLLSNRLSKLSNRFDNRLYREYKHSTGCQTRLTTSLTTGCIVYTVGYQTGCTTRFDNRLNEQWLFVQHGCQTGLTTDLTTGCIV